MTKDDRIDPTAGIVLAVRVGDMVTKGDLLATLYTTEKPSALPSAAEAVLCAITVSESAPTPIPLIYKIITGESKQ